MKFPSKFLMNSPVVGARHASPLRNLLLSVNSTRKERKIFISRLSSVLWMILIGIMLSPVFANASTTDIFSTVPDGDSTYQKLAQLAKAGLLDKEEALSPLTRYDVARRLLKAQRKYDELVVAQADMEIPAPPADGVAATAPSDQTAVSVAPGPPTPEADDDASLAKAAENLHSLQEAYQSELTKVKDRLKALSDEVDQADVDQYDLRKRIKGITQLPSISIHGLGRAFGFSQQDWGSLPSYISIPGIARTYAYLDLDIDGTVSKEISWKALIRQNDSISVIPNTEFWFITIRSLPCISTPLGCRRPSVILRRPIPPGSLEPKQLGPGLGSWNVGPQG